jgi:hypothetical protein
MSKNKKAGNIFQIPLDDGTYGFGRILDNGTVAFYDLRVSKIPDIEDIIQSDVLFKIWVMEYAFTNRAWKKKWKILGNIPLEDELKKDVIFCRQDAISKKCYLYFKGGIEEKTTCEECAKYEIAAAWDPEHIEDRLLDHFMDKPNMWVESMKVKI